MGELAVTQVGHGPDLVLVHGWAMNARVFEPLMPYLTPRWRVHCVDLPGHGRSRVVAVGTTLQAWVEAVAAVVPAQAVWCGWSLGGLVALECALHHPERVQGLGMICASPCFVRTPQQPLGVSPEIFQDFARGLREDYRATFERFLALEVLGNNAPNSELAATRSAILAEGEPDPAVLAVGLELLEHSDLSADVSKLACPSLWIAGRRDRLVQPRAMQAAASLAPHARFELVAHAGHAPFLTHPAEVAALLNTLKP